MRIGRLRRRSTQTPAGSVKRMNGRKSSTPIRATSNALASSIDDRDEAEREVVDRASELADRLRRPELQEVAVAPETAARPDAHGQTGSSRGESGSATPGSAAPSSVVRGSSSIGSGISRRWRCGENRIQRKARPAADRSHDDRLAQADPRSERAAGERSDRDRSPDDEAHDRVHAPLQPRRADRLPVAHLDDVVDDDRVEEHELRHDEERDRRVAVRSEGDEQVAGPKSADMTIVVGPIPKRRDSRIAVNAASERAGRSDREHDPDHACREAELANQEDEEDREREAREEVGRRRAARLRAQVRDCRGRSAALP